MLSYTEENYLKAILHISSRIEDKKEAGTNELAQHLAVKPATVNNMLKKLKEKKLIHNERYGKIRLSVKGKSVALQVVRKHRLWETFLFEKLSFSWDEVHAVAEQLEHIQSEKLIERLDQFLGFPLFDPHGDPIPRKNGQIPEVSAVLLKEVALGKTVRVVAVRETQPGFLQYLEQLNIRIGTRLKVVGRVEFDESIQLKVGRMGVISVSKRFAENVLVG